MLKQPFIELQVEKKQTQVFRFLIHSIFNSDFRVLRPLVKQRVSPSVGCVEKFEDL